MGPRLLPHARPLTDAGFRLLVAIDATTPREATEHFLSIADLALLLPRSFHSVRRGLAELEWHGWIRRRRSEGNLCVDLLYRRPDWRAVPRFDSECPVVGDLSRAM